LNHTRPLILLGWLAALTVLACASPNEPPAPDGRIVLRFDSPPAENSTGAMVPAQSLAAATFDSVVVRVFRSGSGIVQETAKGVPLTGSPVEVSVGCIAEIDKRVSVELFCDQVMTYHGANTDVDVLAGMNTPVAIDAYEFLVDTVLVSPPTVPEGTAFNLRWNRASAASWYLVQSSTTIEFATIDWEQAVTDTLLVHESPPGKHFFRVVPRTPFAFGHPKGSGFTYVFGSSGNLSVDGFDPPRVIPGEHFTIVGENLDFPGTTARIGPYNLPIVSAGWDSLVVMLPRVATTNDVTVTSGSVVLGSDTSDDELVALRVAYVTVTGLFAGEYVNALEKHNDDFGDSGVVALSIRELDTRDMDVFDVIVVAHDTGTLPINWGGNPNLSNSRANAIATSGADVLAIGKGGAVFLSMVVNGANLPTLTSVDNDRQYYEFDTSAEIFNNPHSVGGPDLIICQKPGTSVAYDISSPYPSTPNLYAATGKSCLIICQPNDEWALADFRFSNTDGKPVVYFFWGYASSPEELSNDGSDVLGNVMYMLYRDSGVTPP
jgi:hypothetical protein